MAGFAIEHQGKGFTPDGCAHIANVETYNQKLEREQIAELQAHPERAFLYVKHSGFTNIHGETSPKIFRTPEFPYWKHTGSIMLWTGVVLDAKAWIGELRRDNFGGKRAAVDCLIFGVRYTGWYFYSAGDYCRLKRAKRQPLLYATHEQAKHAR